jgi:transcriptional regulator with XRE-family HTH domain
MATVPERPADHGPDAPDSQDRYAVALGWRLRAVRRHLGWSVHAVEALSDNEFKASVLSAYERGERRISVPRLKRLARLYDVPVDQLLPQDDEGDDDRVRASAPHAGSTLPRRRGDRSERAGATGDKITLDLVRLASIGGPEGDLVRRVVSSIQCQRRRPSGPTITIRAGDVETIAWQLGLSSSAMAQRLDELGLRIKP